jgi:hypothetical protein
MVTTVKTNLADTGRQRPLRDQLANRLGRRLITAITDLIADTLVQRTDRYKRATGRVIHDLTTNILQAAEHSKPRASSDATRRLTHPPTSPLPHPT